MFWSKESLVVLPIAHFLMFSVAFLISLLLKNKSEKIKELPINILSIILIVMEIIKQIQGIIEGYSLWSLPLHFCSFFIFFTIFHLLGKGKIKDFGKTISFVWSFLILTLILVNPESIYGTAIAKVYHEGIIDHSFLFHEFVFLYFFLSLFLKQVKFKLKDLIYMPMGLTVYIMFAVPAAYILNVNFCSILYSTVPFVDAIRTSTNQIIYNIVQYMFGLVSLCLLYLICYFINKMIEKSKHKKQVLVINQIEINEQNNLGTETLEENSMALQQKVEN